jgi:hypothetical protein
MKDLKITAPQGYEIDKDNSTFENIVFKKIKELPKAWENLKQINGFYTTTMSLINVVLRTVVPNRISPTGRNIFKTEEQAKASIALAQLSQLRDVYRAGWVPDWSSLDLKYCIYFTNKGANVYYLATSNEFLSFQDMETAELFLENFRDLIEQAKPLMS